MSVLEKKTVLGIALCLLIVPYTTWGQQPPPSSQSQSQSETWRPLSREEILESARWRHLRRSFANWLSVQKIYTPTEVSQLKAALNARVSSMSADELEDFLHDSEDRLDALMSDEATEARAWLGFLTPDARRKQLARLGTSANVFDMTGGELRQSLRQFEVLRGSDAAAQTAHNLGEEKRASQAREDRQVRDQSQIASRERMATGAQQRFDEHHSPYRPLPGGPTAAGRYNNSPGLWANPWGGISRRMW